MGRLQLILCNKNDPVPYKVKAPLPPASSHAVLELVILFFCALQTHTFGFIYPSQIRGSSGAEVGFSWQTSTKHQHRIYRYILISIHCKIPPTVKAMKAGGFR